MNIFFIGYSLEKDAGGIENYTYTILKYLQECGHNILVYTKNNNCDDFENIELKGIKFLDRFLLGKRIAKKINANQKDIDLYLCGHLNLVDHMEKIVDSNKNYDLFVYGIDSWAGRFKKKHKTLKKLNRVISISSFTSNQIIKQGFGGEIIYIPPVIDANKYLESESQTFNNQLKKDKIHIITVGRLSKEEQYKGHDIVIKALNILKNKGISNIQYNIVGKGNDKKRLEELVSKLSLEDIVKFYGFVEDEELKKLYHSSDIFVMPSNVSLNPQKPEGEGFGIVFIEAGATGLPLVGPETGGSMDIIDDGINGLTCNPTSPKDVSEKLLKLINDEELRIKLGQNAQRKVLNNFTHDHLQKYIDPLVK